MKAVEGLRRRGFEAVFAKTAAEAAEIVMKEAETAQSVGWGGSESVKALGVRERGGRGPRLLTPARLPACVAPPLRATTDFIVTT